MLPLINFRSFERNEKKGVILLVKVNGWGKMFKYSYPNHAAAKAM